MAERVESKVHKYITENRVRLEAFFVVYDRLRHRHVTRSQFFRALNVALNNTLLVSREEEEAMFEKYGRSDGTMNYRVFCDNCTKIERNLERTPLKEVWGDDVILDTRRNPLSPQNEKYFMKHLLPNLQHIAREQGLVVKNQFIDFDFNHNGTCALFFSLFPPFPLPRTLLRASPRSPFFARHRVRDQRTISAGPAGQVPSGVLAARHCAARGAVLSARRVRDGDRHQLSLAAPRHLRSVLGALSVSMPSRNSSQLDHAALRHHAALRS